MSPIDVSICVVNYNGASVLKPCIESIAASHCKYNYEIILVDNASSDDSIAELQATDIPLTLIQNTKNLGFAAANNQAAERAHGKYLLLLNSDTVLPQDSLEGMIDHAETVENFGALSPRLANMDGSTQAQGSALSSWIYNAVAPRAVSFISGACFLIERDRYLSMDGFDEALFFYNEDLDLCKRLRKAGRQLIYFPKYTVYHHGGASSLGSSLSVEGYCGSIYLSKKYYGLLGQIIYRALIALYIFPLCMICAGLRFIIPNIKASYENYKKISSMILSGSRCIGCLERANAYA